MPTQFEVIVIGAGPSGALAARTLAEQGRQVLLLEKGQIGRRQKACGGLLPLAAFNHYHLDPHSIQTRLEQEVMVFPWGERRRPAQVVTMHRAEFDASIALQAASAGAQVCDLTTVRAVTRSAEQQFQVQAIHGGGTQVFESRLVIFADGVNTLAYRSFGIGFNRQPQNTSLGLELTLDAPANRSDTYWMYFDHPLLQRTWGYAWAFPNQNDFNVGVFSPTDDSSRLTKRDLNGEDRLANHLTGRMDEILRGRTVIKRIGAYIPMQPAKALCGNGVLVTGDAAGLVFPLTAGGIGTALWSGALCGQAAAMALKQDRLEKAVLLSYQHSIKQSSIYRELSKQFLLYRIHRAVGRFDRHGYSKLFQMYKLKSELSLHQFFNVLLFR